MYSLLFELSKNSYENSKFYMEWGILHSSLESVLTGHLGGSAG